MESHRELMKSNTYPSLYYLSSDIYRRPNDRKKTYDIAAFDLDGTFIEPITGIIANVNNWRFLIDPNIIKQLYDDSWNIVIFSNQKYKGKALSNSLNKVQLIIDQYHDLNVNVSAYVASAEDEFRKPDIGMWRQFLLDHNIDQSEISNASFYVGDAEGPRSSNPAYRWSDTDKVFAENIGLAFYTPDRFLS